MAIKAPDLGTPNKRARDLLRERSVLIRSNQRRADLAARVRAYERRYGMASGSVHAAIDRGELKESQDVCRWIMDYDLLSRTKAS